jgi:hypothetical protein
MRQPWMNSSDDTQNEINSLHDDAPSSDSEEDVWEDEYESLRSAIECLRGRDNNNETKQFAGGKLR